MHKNATKCNKTLSKWCKNKHVASKIIDMFETYQSLCGSQKRAPPKYKNTKQKPGGSKIGGENSGGALPV
jgi:hypothetical protein